MSKPKQVNPTTDWQNRPLDPSFLLDSGLLFEINRNTLHLLGLALGVKTRPDGTAEIVLQDFRADPATALFDAPLFEMGTMKLKAFMESFGHRQMERRSKKLGWSCQGYPPRKKS